MHFHFIRKNWYKGTYDKKDQEKVGEVEISKGTVSLKI